MKTDNIIKFTPETVAAIKKYILEHILKEGKNNAFSDLSQEWGGDAYIEEDYSAIEYEKEFIAAWNKAFKDHIGEFVVCDKFISNMEHWVNDAIKDDIDGNAVFDMLTSESFESGVVKMEKDVKEFLKSKAGKKLLEEKIADNEENMNALKAQIEKLGYDVKVSKKSEKRSAK